MPQKIERYDFFVSEYIGAQEKLRKTPQYNQAMKASDDLVAAIARGIQKAESAEDLVDQELALQQTDISLAKTREERTAIQNAMTDYRSLLLIIAQMRRSPVEYLVANAGQKDNRMSYEKQPNDKGPSQIDANVMRCKNRALHATDDLRQVWEARIHLAGETKRALKLLHDQVAEKFAKDIQRLPQA